MTAILKVDTIQDTAGNNIINESSDTITIGASGDTIALAGTTVTGITQGITEADQFRLTTDFGSNGDITANLERTDDASFAKIGTGMSLSSGIYTFPSTGLYQIINQSTFLITGDDNVRVDTKVTTNNSSYVTVAYAIGGGDSSGNMNNNAFSISFVNVTNTSNVKVKFTSASVGTNSAVVGATDISLTSFTFIRLGDSQ
jgi:hypothetical protein|tara:strand:+ start:186 stop:785 length:600 start_codon:yes stop_codon:yes gene_type:complete